MLSDRVYLKELSEQFGYRDLRLKAVKRWCNTHSLEIFKAGRQQYVFRAHLDQALRQTESQQRTAVIIKTKTAMKTKISIPKQKKFESLFMTCNTCRRNYSTDDAVNCKHELKYKARVSVKTPDGRYTNKSQVLEASNYNDALIELIKYKESLGTWDDIKSGMTGNTPLTHIPVQLPLYAPPIDQYRTQPRITIAVAIQSYMDYLNNVGIPAHLQKKRTDANNDEAKIILRKHLIGALKANDISGDSLFTDISDDVVGMIYTYVEKYSNKYFNKIFSRLTTWADHTIDKYSLHFKNPFTKVTRKKVVTNVQTITADEFEKLLAIITARD